MTKLKQLMIHISQPNENMGELERKTYEQLYNNNNENVVCNLSYV
jgi:hypothetical protein